MKYNKNIYIWSLLLTILTLLTITTSVSGLDEEICLNPISANTTCLLVTPTLFCDVNATGYTYELFTNNGTTIENGNLTLYNEVDDSYYFNFNKDIGSYYVKICDGSTRQIEVTGDDIMIGLTNETWIFVVLILLFVLFLWLAFKITPLFLILNSIIFTYFAFYTYTTLSSWFITVIMSLVAVIFLFIGIIGTLYQNK